MNRLKNLTILFFVCINLCCVLSVGAQCNNNSNKKVGALIAAERYADRYKTPLILIHGIHGTSPNEELVETNQYWIKNRYWMGFIRNFDFDSYLKEKYALYFFQYYSNQASVQDIACELGFAIDEKIPDRQHVIVAHSMGG